MFLRGGKKTIHFNHLCSMTSQQVIIHLANRDRLAHTSLKWDISENTCTIINTVSESACVVKRLKAARGDKIAAICNTKLQAMASASFLKSSTVLDKSEWVKGQTLRQPSFSVVRCHPATAASALTIRAGSYADELVKTAVCIENSLHFLSLLE